MSTIAFNWAPLTDADTGRSTIVERVGGQRSGVQEMSYKTP